MQRLAFFGGGGEGRRMARARLAQAAPDSNCTAAETDTAFARRASRVRERDESVHTEAVAEPECANVPFAQGTSAAASVPKVAPPQRDMPFSFRGRAVLAVSMQANNLLTLLALTSLPLASATNHTDDGLSGGAIAGIIIGSLAGVILIGLAVWWFFFRGMEGSTKSGGDDASIESYAGSGKRDGRELPMVALRVSGNDDDL